MYFDARSAKLLKPGEHLLVDGCSGLRLVASATRKAWTYRYKDTAGRMKQVGLGFWPTMPVQEAVARWSELLQKRDSGIDPVQSKLQARSKAVIVAGDGPMTVRKVVTAYMEGPLHDNRAPASFRAAQRALERLLDADISFAEMAAKDLSRAKAFAVIDARKATPTAAAKLRSMLGAAWEFAQDSGLLEEAPNWWREILRGKLPSQGKILGGKHVGRQRRVLHQSEVAQLLHWLPNMHSLGADAVVMYLWTATRGSEIFSMQPEHLFLDEHDVFWWTVPKAKTKNARFDAVDLRVPLFGRARSVVQHRLNNRGNSSHLFETLHGKQYTQHDFSTYVYDLQPYSVKSKARPERLVLPVTNWTPHHLRKTARTLLAQLGCPNEIGEAILGHMPAEIVGIYNAYTYDAERVHWLGKLSDFLEALFSGLPARP